MMRAGGLPTTLSIIVIASLGLVPAETRGQAALGAVDGSVRVLKDGQPKFYQGDVVVYLGGVPARAASRRHEIHTRNHQFDPPVSVVVKGTTVDFPNDDKIFHNAFSTSAGASFDLGAYRHGQRKSVQLRRVGVVDVGCNMHPNMAARILVVPNTMFATTDASGWFRIDDVPAGTYPIEAWHPTGEPVKRGRVTVEPGKTTSVTFDVSET